MPDLGAVVGAQRSPGSRNGSSPGLCSSLSLSAVQESNFQL